MLNWGSKSFLLGIRSRRPLLTGGCLFVAGAPLLILIFPSLVPLRQWVSTPDTIVFSAMSIGESAVWRVRVRNNHPFRTVRIREVATTCGCVSVTEYPRHVPPLHSADVILSTRAYANSEAASARLRILLEGDPRPIVVEITAPVKSLGNGWPEKLIARHAGTAGLAELSQEYATRVTRSKVFVENSDKEVNSSYDSRTGVLSFDLPGERSQRLVAVVTLDHDLTQRWAAPIEIVSRESIFTSRKAQE